jgi:hypothetical protein
MAFAVGSMCWARRKTGPRIARTSTAHTQPSFATQKKGPTIQKDIAKGSPAKGGQEGNDGNADNIEPFGGARENSRCGKS